MRITVVSTALWITAVAPASEAFVGLRRLQQKSPLQSLTPLRLADVTYSPSPTAVESNCTDGIISVYDEPSFEPEIGVATELAAVFRIRQPLTDREKQQQAWLVHAIKAHVFDRFFASPTLERSYARFYALETIARIPFFAFLSVLHMYETLGWWRRADLLQLHFEESWNELHHLLIMEELGGEKRWFDRFLAQHVSCFYYWMIVAFYLANPLAAYHFNELIEKEAYHTYDDFLNENGAHLKEQPAPKVAVKYYGKEAMGNLYDCFAAIRDDEAEHFMTMQKLQCWK